MERIKNIWAKMELILAGLIFKLIWKVMIITKIIIKVKYKAIKINQKIINQPRII